MKHGKKYVESAKLIDRTKLYDTAEALDITVKGATAKFDETVELHVRLGVDSRHADQQVRGAVVLPNGTGKKVRVAVFAKGDKVDAALAAGAEYVGAEDLMEKIQGGFMDFDVCIASPDMMGLVGRLGRFLVLVVLCQAQKLVQLHLMLLKLLQKLKQVKLSTVLTKQTLFTAQSVKYHSALKNSRKTLTHLWKLSLKQSQQQQKASTLSQLQLLQQWALV